MNPCIFQFELGIPWTNASGSYRNCFHMDSIPYVLQLYITIKKEQVYLPGCVDIPFFFLVFKGKTKGKLIAILVVLRGWENRPDEDGHPVHEQEYL
jgi:hypothetical protein